MKVYKVRALVQDASGAVYMITASEPHVLQLPGGAVKPGKEGWTAALVREVREETGFRKVRIVGKPTKIKVRRNGVTEVTRCYRVIVSGRRRAPELTRRERVRGLTVTRFGSYDKAVRALRRRVKTYGRSAATRDLALARAV